MMKEEINEIIKLKVETYDLMVHREILQTNIMSLNENISKNAKLISQLDMKLSKSRGIK